MMDHSYAQFRSHNQNRAAVLKLLCTGASCSRAELARALHLSKMALTNIVVKLLEAGILIEQKTAPAIGSRGRSPVRLALADTSPLVGGIVLSRNGCGAVLTDLSARIVKRRWFLPAPQMAGEALLAQLLEHFCALRREVDRPVVAVGFTAPGPVDREKGRILNPIDLFGLRELAICDYTSAKLSLPVFLAQNMVGAVLAETMFGHGKSLQDFIYIGGLRGISVCVVLGGRLILGEHGKQGGIGHMTVNFDGPPCFCGNRGCLEQYVNISQLVEQTANVLQKNGTCCPPDFDWSTLIHMARQGDRDCERALNALSDHLAVAVVNLVHLFDCGEIFLGHDIALAEGLLDTRLELQSNARLQGKGMKRVRVRTSAFGVDTPLIGAASVAIDQIFQGNLL